MSNNSNGQGTLSSGYKRTGSFDASALRPDAPEGEFEATIVRNRTKVKPTNAGDPMITFQVRLDTAADDANESYQGVELPLRVVFFDDNDGKKVKGNRMTKVRLADLSKQTGVELSIIPGNLREDPEVLLVPFIEAIEGKSITVWTTHRRNNDTGEVMVDVNLRKPGSYTTPGTTRTDE